MENMKIFEPAMCCETGLCGVSVDPELLRISTVIASLKKSGVTVERYNLSGNPQAFIMDEVINDYLKHNGVEGLPVTELNGKIIITGRYPSNNEFSEFLNLPKGLLAEEKSEEETTNENGGCCCGGSC